MVNTEIMRFAVVRDQDPTGRSGTGCVAVGVIFPDGIAVLRWLSKPHVSTAIYNTFEELTTIHGHPGTRFEMED